MKLPLKVCMVLAVYRFFVWLLTPALWGLLAWRKYRGFEDARGCHEKRGLRLKPRPQGQLIWVHAASNGETLSALPLITHFLAANPHAHVLLTTVTRTAATLVTQRGMPRVIHSFAPFDHPLWVHRFLKHWNPDVIIWVESELWPTTLLKARKTGCPIVLLNARLSARSAQRWRLMPALAKQLLSVFDGIFAQTDVFAARIRELGAPHVHVAGNLKFMAPPLPYNTADLTPLSEAIGARPVILFASTHDGEEVMAARAHAALKMAWPKLLTIIIPRHPRRGPDICASLKQTELYLEMRSERPVPYAACDIYIADTLGELGLFFSVCKHVVMGNSFITEPGGGHNPLEPAHFGCAIAYGPSMYNFTDMTSLLEDAHAAQPLTSEHALHACLHDWLQNPVQTQAQGVRAHDIAKQHMHGMNLMLAHLRPLCATRGIQV